MIPSEVCGHPNMLCCWIAGSGARVADTLGDEEVMDELTNLLRKFTGDPGARFNTVPKTSPKIVPKSVLNSLTVQTPIFGIF